MSSLELLSADFFTSRFASPLTFPPVCCEGGRWEDGGREHGVDDGLVDETWPCLFSFNLHTHHFTFSLKGLYACFLCLWQRSADAGWQLYSRAEILPGETWQSQQVRRYVLAQHCIVSIVQWFCSVVLGPVALELIRKGNMLEMQTIGPHPNPVVSDTSGLQPSALL